MNKVEPVSAQAGHNVATLNLIASWQLATGGGHISGPIVVQRAGSSDAVISLYDGTSTSGALLAVHTVGKVGPLAMPNVAFGKGLFAQMSGTTPAQVQMMYTGSAVVI